MDETKPTVCCIGASAGGLDPLRQLLGRLTVPANLAVVVAQHLSPRHPTILPDLLARDASVPVVLAEEGMLVKGGQIYVAPPNADLTIRDLRFRVEQPEQGSGAHPSIDLLLISAASVFQDRSIAVILSGSGSDGAIGVRAVKSADGIALAQDASAKYASMPNAADQPGLLDARLPVEDLADLIGEYARGLPMPELNDKIPDHGPGMEKIFSLLYREFGIDLAEYRDSTIERRIARRMSINRASSLDEYAGVVESSRNELLALRRDVLVGVTKFFRDAPAFTKLSQVLKKQPALREGRRLRVWVPGCSTGEEAYSLAILLSELAKAGGPVDDFIIFATDANADAIRIARNGTFPISVLSELPDKVDATRYFNVGTETVQVSEALRSRIVFSVHNLGADPYFIDLDLISCRNVLIYFNQGLQERVLGGFHYALKPSALLFLGKSESTGAFSSNFKPADQSSKIYHRIGTAKRSLLHRLTPAGAPREAQLKRKTPPVPSALRYQAMISTVASPPSIVVEASGRPLYISDGCRTFLEMPVGVAEFDIYSLFPADLRAEVRAMIKRVDRENTEVHSQMYPMRTDAEGEGQQFSFTARPCEDGDSADSLIVMSFYRHQRAYAAHTLDESPTDDRSLTAMELEHENQLLRENMKSLLREVEISNDELQTANEELQASNEELQSTNEELETANEELQSTNEELTTINEAMEAKSEELGILNAYLEALVTSLPQPLMVVDRNLRLTHFNAPLQALCRTQLKRDSSHLTDVQPVAGRAKVRKAVEAVLSGKSASNFKAKIDGAHWQMRIAGITDGSGQPLGAIIAMNDVSALVEANDSLLASEKLTREMVAVQRTILDCLPAQVALLAPDGKIVAVNEHWRLFARENGADSDEIGIGQNYLSVTEQADEATARDFCLGLREVLNGERDVFSMLYPCHAPERERWYKAIVTAVPHDAREQFGALVAHFDQTDRITSELSLKDALAELQRAEQFKDNFLASVSHEVRTPLNAILGFSEVLRANALGTSTKRMTSQYVTYINEAARSLLELVNDILNLNKARAGTFDLHLETIQSETLVETVYKTFAGPARLAKVQLTLAADRNKVAFEGDVGLLERVLSNLVDNAVKYSREGGTVTVKVKAEAHEETDGVTFLVEDDGPGIPADVQKRVLEPFFQVENSYVRRNSGVGLGLAIARQFIDLHHGAINITSNGDKGTVAQFWLPLAHTKNPSQAAQGPGPVLETESVSEV